MEILTEKIVYNHHRLSNPCNHPSLSMKHTHNMYEIIFFEKGDVNYVIEDRKYSLKKYDLVFTRPLKYHYVETKSNSEYARYNILFDASLVDAEILNSLPANFEVINCPSEGIISDLFKRLDYYSSVLSETSFTDILCTLIKELLYNLSLSADSATNISFKTSPFLAQVLEYINENLFTIKDIKDVCAHFFVSQQYFFRLFQTQLKITPRKYLNGKRLLYSQTMLRQGKKPTEVYLLCGFESYVGFYKQYIKTFGYPPSKEKQIQIN
ncbi:MAG: AraC family transcriptional regulator [Clostridiales bacterium]|nr:AraC family transcriptional regulator [Clostridiales bacterium]